MRIISVLFSLLLITSVSAQAEDTRTSVDLPADVRDAFLNEMLGQLDTLDDIVTAIGEGDFTQAGYLAELKLDFGHHMWTPMIDKGVPLADIAKMKNNMRGMGMGAGRGKDMTDEERAKMHEQMTQIMAAAHGGESGQGMRMGFGRYMPPEFRMMGQSFHEAGAQLAVTLKAAATPPSAADYQKAIAALSDVTTACRSCHSAFRVR